MVEVCLMNLEYILKVEMNNDIIKIVNNKSEVNICLN